MGRPDDIRIKQELKKQKTSTEVDTLKELVKQQAEMIKSLVDTLSKIQTTPVVVYKDPHFIGDHGTLPEYQEAPKERPKIDSFFINPSSELTITDSINLTENKEEKIVQENINEEAEKLKSLMKRRK